jgi:hypothetical protein
VDALRMWVSLRRVHRSAISPTSNCRPPTCAKVSIMNRSRTHFRLPPVCTKCGRAKICQISPAPDFAN